MGKVEMLQAMQEEACASGEVGPPKKTTRKRKVPSSAEEGSQTERRKKSASTSGTRPEATQEKGRAPTPPTATPDETPAPTQAIPTAEATSSRNRSKRPPILILPRIPWRRSDRPPPFDPSKDSLVASPTAVMATRYICNMAPEPDVPVLIQANDTEVIAHFSAHIAPVCFPFPEPLTFLHMRTLLVLTPRLCVGNSLGGEMVRRLTHSHQKVRSTRRNFERASRQHAEVMAKLEELEACRARELEEAKTQQELLEAKLIAEKESRVAEKEAMSAELEEAKARSEQEAERLKGDAQEEFLSPEFDVLLGKRAFSYFKDGFRGCLTQFRANGYSEEEHPASFLDLQEALAKLGDEDEEEEGEQEEGEVEDGAEDNAPPS
ncbi:hypothetical protein F511_18902 [Dorcoceras hygrometricum]|uniref:Uncharacterized protein n=1 Tax=Dorcoceras hygrometricum TaxID=472368 RepID=A0A2Z7CB11_9LAMI|nr:hypothetical protein F511_18902 [Dorcoceras hygrometricum]